MESRESRGERAGDRWAGVGVRRRQRRESCRA